MAVRQQMSRALGLIGLTALAAACTDDGVSLHSICAIAPTIDTDSCTWDPGSSLCVAEGVLNLSAADHYRLNLKVESGLKPRQRDVPPLGETNGLQITRAKVELRVPTGETIGDLHYIDSKGASQPLDNPYWVSASGYIQPGSSAVVAVTIIGPKYVAALAPYPDLPQIVAAVKVHGTTLGQEDVDSDEFSWPITLIKASPELVANVCHQMDYCPGSLGQDDFAQACRNSSTSN